MNFFIDNIFLFGLVILSGGALLWPSLQRRGAQASPLEATIMINKSRASILDVREASEFAVGHLRDAKNIALGELPKRIDELEKLKSKPMIVVCQTGARSPKATKILQQAGFTEVFSLDGGLSAWQAQNLPVTK